MDIPIALTLITIGAVVLAFHLLNEWAQRNVDRMVAAALDDDFQQHAADAMALCEPPIYAEVWAQMFAAELRDDEAVRAWMA